MSLGRTNSSNNSSRDVPVNGKVISLPAYDSDIKANTFVSTYPCQSGFITTALEDSNIATATTGTSDIEQIRLYSLDYNHFLMISITYNYIIFKVILINNDNTCSIVSSKQETSLSNSTLIDVVKVSDNRFFIYKSAAPTASDNYITAYANRITIKVNSDYSITTQSNTQQIEAFAYTSSQSGIINTPSDGILNVSYVGHDDLLLVTGVKVNSNYNRYSTSFINAIYKLNSSGKLTLQYEIDNRSYTSHTSMYCAGITSEGKSVILHNYSSNNNYYMNLYTITTSSTTQITDSSISFSSLGSIKAYMVPINNKYIIKFNKYIGMFNISNTQIEHVGTYLPSSTGVISPYSGNIVLDPSKNCLYDLYGDYGYLRKIDVNNWTYTNLIYNEPPYFNCYGMVYYSTNTFFGMIDKSNTDISPIGIGKIDMTTTQQCVKNSLDTDTIEGITLTDCTKNNPGKIAILNK